MLGPIVKIPFSNISRTKTESLLNDTPNLKVLDTLQVILDQLFREFLTTTGKYRRYIETFQFSSSYAIDASTKTGQTQIHFRVLNQSMEKTTPSIQIILGQPIQQADLNVGYERSVFAKDQGKVFQRHTFDVSCILLVAAHTSTLMTELGQIAVNIVTRYIPQIFSGVIQSSDLNWQLAFPRKLEVSDVIQKRDEIRGNAPEQIHYNEWTMPLMFEQLVMLGNPPEIDAVVLHAPELITNPSWQGPLSLTMGTTTQYQLLGRRDAIPETVNVSDPKVARVQKITDFEYNIVAVRPGSFTLQSIYSNIQVPIAQLDVTVTR